MPLSAGTKLGPYEIVAPLGAGGMGEVYRARDPKLGRDVAIKLIPDAFATDPDRLARFEREAKLLASLQHANIAVLYGLEESGGRRFLVMECVEGESLAQRLKRGPLPLAETLDAARAIAAALETAHEGGIVHRDLKPGNVMVTPGGDVKVLDFGLAKGGAAGASSDPSVSASPTMTYAGTQAGVILGTAGYMSPEQARGKSVDRRTDIWSFGCVVFECLTGRQAFAGETVSDIVARILQTEPEWAALPSGTPERLRTLLRRCLEKDAKRRLRDIGEARIEIEDLLAARVSGSMPAAGVRTPRALMPAWAAMAVTAVVATAATWFVPRLVARPPAPAAARFEVLAPRGRNLLSDAAAVSISPDGKMIAMGTADSSGTASIWIRSLDALEARELPGTAGVQGMFWSPDSRSIAYFATGRLSKIALDGASPERICDTKAARGGAWNRDGTILFAPYSNGGLYRVSANGGAIVQVTHPDSAHGVTGHRFPVFLPDGKHFLFSTVPAGSDGLGGLCVGSLDGGETKELARVEAGSVYVEPGWLLTTRNGALVARRFDAGALRLIGEQVSIGDPLVQTDFSGCPLLSVSTAGTLAFMTREDIPGRLVWLDWAQRELGEAPVAPGLYHTVRISPDDRRALLVAQAEPTRSELRMADLERGVVTTLSEPAESAELPRWSPDGARVAYIDEATRTIRIRSLADQTLSTYLANDPAYKRVNDWARDGRSVLFARLDATTKWDLWELPLEGDSAPRPMLRGPANEEFCSLSPDGRWLSFLSDESGRSEVVVQPFGAPGLRYQVTIGGGIGFWSVDGKSVYFMDGRKPGMLEVADILPGKEFSLGPPRTVVRLRDDIVDADVVRDGRRFLAILPAAKARPQVATVLQNWESAIRKH
jgi:Tol biopolymer transport system component